jgi:protein-tyrosine-phosphatase
MRESDSSRLVIRHTDLAMLNLNLVCMDRCGFLIAVRPVGAEQCRQRIRIIPVAVQAMAERASTERTEQPKIITTEAARASDVVITMGCGTRAPIPMEHATRTGFRTTRPDKTSTTSATRSAQRVRNLIAELISPR